jgi:fluoroquinolone transport system permease protein
VTIAFMASALLVRAFSLTQWRLWMLIVICVLTSLASVGVALLLFSFSHNRVEGMAMAKMSGLLLMGLPVPFFLLSNTQFLFSPLPTFWIAKLGMEPNLLYFIAALLTSMLWIMLLYSKFRKKLM